MSQKNQSLEILSNIKGAQEYTEIWDLFKILDDFDITTTSQSTNNTTETSQLLREDNIRHSLEKNKHIILDNSSGINEDNQFIL